MSTTAPAAGARRFDAGGPTLAEVGEAEVLRRLAEVSAAAPAGDLAVGPGDDAAVWRPPPGLEAALSQDALVEDRDYRREWITPAVLGRRALHVALSDLAGMGATPAWCMATLCAPGRTQLEDVLEIQRGLVAAAVATGCAVAGGDLSDIDGPVVIDVSVGGTALPGSWMLRGAGAPGDVLLVTGELGAAAAGLRCLLGDAAASQAHRDRWVGSLLQPLARLDEGRRLAACGVGCGGDLSDGLLVDAARTAAASGCAAELWLDHVPVAADVVDAFGPEWPELAIAGGEDFELLVAVRPDGVERLERDWPRRLAPLHRVGRLVAGAGVRLLAAPDGEALTPPVPRARHWR